MRRGRRHGDKLAEKNRYFPNAGDVPGQNTEPLFDGDYPPSKMLLESGDFDCSSTSRSSNGLTQTREYLTYINEMKRFRQ